MLRCVRLAISALCLAALGSGAAESSEDPARASVEDGLDASVAGDDACSSDVGRQVEDDSSCSLSLRQLRGQVQQRGSGSLGIDHASDEADARKPSTTRVLKGISYGPSPLLTLGKLPQDDFFCDSAKAQWGSRGRGDLHIMRTLGANAVRLYGNDPDADHSDFLDTAYRLELSVIPGISDFPFLQSIRNCRAAGNCTCYALVKDAYRRNLEKGFLLPNRSYHPALEYVISVNEPDMKLSNVAVPHLFVQSIVTGIDGMLDAEKGAGVVGTRPNITATMSVAECPSCTQPREHPAIAQMLMLRDAMHNPSKYGIAPRNDLVEFYKTRFTNSFNAASASIDLETWLSDVYAKEFPETPVFIAEYHKPDDPFMEQDMTSIMYLAQESPLFSGLVFSEFQMRYDRQGHPALGMFDPAVPLGDDMLGVDGLGTETGPGSSSVKDLSFYGERFRVPCLRPIRDIFTHKSLAQIVAAAYGGINIDERQLCKLNPTKELVDSAGFDRIWMADNATSMSLFIARVAEKMGGDVPRGVPISFAKDFVGETATFAALVSALHKGPSWAIWSEAPACVVDREELKENVVNAVKLACDSGKVECRATPSDCRKSIWDEASWVFGSYYHQVRTATSKPLDTHSQCYFSGAAQLVSPKNYASLGLRSECVVPLSTI